MTVNSWTIYCKKQVADWFDVGFSEVTPYSLLQNRNRAIEVESIEQAQELSDQWDVIRNFT